MAKALWIIEQGQKGKIFQTYFTGVDANIDTAIADIIANDGFFTDLNQSIVRYVRKANVVLGAIMNGNICIGGIIQTGNTTSYGSVPEVVNPVTGFQNIRRSEFEVPIGTIDGANTDFRVDHDFFAAPTVELNRVIQIPGEDFTWDDNVVTFTIAPVFGDAIRISYSYNLPL